MEQIYKVEDTARKALDIANDIKKNGWVTGSNAGGNINNTESRHQGGTGDNETTSPNEGNTHWVGRPPKLYNEVYTNL